MSFQTSVAITPAIGIPGDFASTNPRHFLVSGALNQPMVAGPDGVQVGRFAVLEADGTVNSNPNAVDVNMSTLGFVHRVMGTALITQWLAEDSMTIYPGQGVELFASGDFFAVADAISGVPVRGAPILWTPATGAITVGGTAVAGTSIDTGFILLSESAVAGQTVMIGKGA